MEAWEVNEGIGDRCQGSCPVYHAV
jgi:hypothetical protein